MRVLLTKLKCGHLLYRGAEYIVSSGGHVVHTHNATDQKFGREKGGKNTIGMVIEPHPTAKHGSQSQLGETMRPALGFVCLGKASRTGDTYSRGGTGICLREASQRTAV